MAEFKPAEYSPKDYPLVPPAEEWWEFELEKYLCTTEHLYDCIGFSEGQACCLEKEWIRNFIKRIIKKTKESKGIK